MSGSRWPSLHALALALGLALAGCSTPPGTLDDARHGGDDADETAPLHRYAQQQRSRAEQAQAQGRWADAALAWEVLSLLRPDDAQVRERLAAARQQIEQLRARHATAARAAQQRGLVDAAQQSWLQVLALDPQDAAAAAALRQIELERSVRAQGGRFARPAAPARSSRGPATAVRDAEGRREQAERTPSPDQGQHRSPALKPISQ